MKLISCNVRGCNSQLKRQLLQWKIQMEKLAIVFIQETKCSSEDLEAFSKCFWKGANTMVLDVKGAARGIGILWNPNKVILSNFLASRNTLSAHFSCLSYCCQRGPVKCLWPLSTCKKTSVFGRA